MSKRADFGLPVFPEGQSVTKCIYQTYQSHTLPPELEENVAYLCKSNPTYKYKLYDDKEALEFIKNNYSRNIVDLFKRIDIRYGAARADLFRYLLMYREGGVYLDIKSTATEPLDSILRESDRYILSHWQYEDWGTNDECAHVPGGEYQQWFIIAAPGHPYLRAVILEVLRRIEAYRPWKNGVGQIGTLRTTGPRPYTNAIFPILHQYGHREVENESKIGLKYTIYNNYEKHRGLSKTYYRGNTVPVIKNSLPIFLEWNARRAGRRLSRILGL